MEPALGAAAAGPPRGGRGRPRGPSPRRGQALALAGAARRRAPRPLGGGRRAARPGPPAAGDLLAQGLHPADQPVPRRLLVLHLRPPPTTDPRAHTMSPDEVLQVAEAGGGSAARRPCSRWATAPRRASRATAGRCARFGHASTQSYLAAMCRMVIERDRPAAPPQRRHPRPPRARRAARGLGQPGDDAGVGLRAALRAGRPPRARPRQAPGHPPGDDPSRGRAAHPVHLGDPDRDRRDPARAGRGAPGAARAPRGARPHPGGHRAELPRQARHPDGRRRRAGPGRADDRLRDRAPGDGARR